MEKVSGIDRLKIAKIKVYQMTLHFCISTKGVKNWLGARRDTG